MFFGDTFWKQLTAVIFPSTSLNLTGIQAATCTDRTSRRAAYLRGGLELPQGALEVPRPTKQKPDEVQSQRSARSGTQR